MLQQNDMSCYMPVSPQLQKLSEHMKKSLEQLITWLTFPVTHVCVHSSINSRSRWRIAWSSRLPNILCYVCLYAQLQKWSEQMKKSLEQQITWLTIHVFLCTAPEAVGADEEEPGAAAAGAWREVEELWERKGCVGGTVGRETEITGKSKRVSCWKFQLYC